ncbi:MAG: NAD(P)/FAD-dependent oxidoreductase [Candidatus Lokiarchaeota archaeon]|nr:NAD(P)/FAD-dependent oxidoreductase [Candidatus Lokiarchaeota archaeon]
MNNIIKEQYDVIVIGSGVGGSGCAALLAAAGYDTILIEKNERLGGACSSYYKNGYTIDVAVHMFAGGKHFQDICKKTNHPEEIKFYTELGARTAMRNKNSPPLSMSLEEGQDMITMYQDFFKMLGATQKEIDDILKVFGKIMMQSKKTAYNYMNIPLTEWLNDVTTSPIVHGLFAYFCGIMFTIPPNIASAGEFIYTMHQGNSGLVYPYGGAIAIPNGFGRIVEKEGGKVLIKNRVKKIIIENNRVEGVQLQDDRYINAPIIVSNAGIKPTVLNLLNDTSMLEKKYINKVKNLIPSFSSITFKVALKRKIITDYDAIHLFYADLDDFKEDSLINVWKSIQEGNIPKEAAFMSPIPSNMDPTLAPKGKQLIIFGGIAPAKLSEGKSWKPWIDKYWEMILDFYPDIEKNLEFLDITTPSDIIKATGKPEAPVEGTALTVNQSGHDRISSIIPNIEGLYIAGDTAGTDIHGIGTQMAVNSGISVFNLIQEKYPNFCKKKIKIKIK